MTSPPEEPSPIGLALEWVSRITTVGVEMVVPGMIGYWIDSRWGSKFFVIVGFFLGLVLGIWHLLAMTTLAERRETESDLSRRPHDRPDEPSTEQRSDDRDLPK